MPGRKSDGRLDPFLHQAIKPPRLCRALMEKPAQKPKTLLLPHFQFEIPNNELLPRRDGDIIEQ
jgi:hypothetical protein